MDDTAADTRHRIIAIYALLLAINVAAWTWAIFAFRDYPVLLGTAFLAYSFGLRHAVDADHIAAIDNVTRKLMQQGKRPVAVGFMFSLGHSTVVFIGSALLAGTALSLHHRIDSESALGVCRHPGIGVFPVRNSHYHTLKTEQQENVLIPARKRSSPHFCVSLRSSLPSRSREKVSGSCQFSDGAILPHPSIQQYLPSPLFWFSFTRGKPTKPVRRSMLTAAFTAVRKPRLIAPLRCQSEALSRAKKVFSFLFGNTAPHLPEIGEQYATSKI